MFLLQHCMSDLEIFALLLSAIIHDVNHTGTTNLFHVNSRYCVELTLCLVDPWPSSLVTDALSRKSRFMLR